MFCVLIWFDFVFDLDSVSAFVFVLVLVLVWLCVRVCVLICFGLGLGLGFVSSGLTNATNEGLSYAILYHAIVLACRRCFISRGAKHMSANA